MAPNLVTLLGLIALAGAYLSIIFYDLTMIKPLPNWTYLAIAIRIYIFQTLDAIDGKQARRTNSSSPLGQLFDHGCDSISWIIYNLSIISFLGIGLSFKSVLILYSSMNTFYVFNMVEYYTSIFLYTVGVIDGTSAQFIIILLNTIAFIYGGPVFNIILSQTLTFIPDVIPRDFLSGIESLTSRLPWCNVLFNTSV